MSHVVELGLIFMDRVALDAALSTFRVQIQHDIPIPRVFASQALSPYGKLPIVAITPSKEALGFQHRELTRDEKKGMVDASEASLSKTKTGYVPVGDLYYGGLSDEFGTNLYKLQGAYYTALLKKSYAGAQVTAREVDDALIVTIDVD